MFGGGSQEKLVFLETLKKKLGIALYKRNVHIP